MQGLHRSAQQRREDGLRGDGTASAACPAVRPPWLACQRAHFAQQRGRGPPPNLLFSANDCPRTLSQAKHSLCSL